MEVAMPHQLAGQPAPRELLTNIPRLVSAYYTEQPNLEEAAQSVAFGTSGHRGTPTQGSFNEAHIMAVCQALVEYRQLAGITGPYLWVGHMPFLNLRRRLPWKFCSERIEFDFRWIHTHAFDLTCHPYLQPRATHWFCRWCGHHALA
jgi:hypothetical protein